MTKGEYDPSNRLESFERSQELDEQQPASREVSLVEQRIDQTLFKGIFEVLK